MILSENTLDLREVCLAIAKQDRLEDVDYPALWKTDNGKAFSIPKTGEAMSTLRRTALRKTTCQEADFSGVLILAGENAYSVLDEIVRVVDSINTFKKRPIGYPLPPFFGLKVEHSDAVGVYDIAISQGGKILSKMTLTGTNRDA